MTQKNTGTKSNGAKTGAGKNSKKVISNRAGSITNAGKGVVVIELNEPSEADSNGTVSPVSSEANGESSTVTSEIPAKKATKAKKVVVPTAAKKKVVATSKPAATNDKKVKLAGSCYHYYRNWLKDFMRSHGVPSARFQKAPESYNGHIMVLESEKVKGLKALETWNKENPDTKELFWDIKK